MSGRRSVLIPSARVRRLVQLVGEAAEVARTTADPLSHLAEGLVELIGSDMGAFARLRGAAPVPGTKTEPFLFTSGWPDDVRRQLNALYAQHDGTALNPLAASVISRTRAGGVTIGRRSEFVTDRDWYRSPYVNEFRRAWRIDGTIEGFVRLPSGRSIGIVQCRGWGGRAYTEVDRALVELYIEACARYLFPPESARSLSPRQREVRRWLLDGAAPKQIAAQLGISIHTVNEYIHGIYCAEGVTTRAELLARALNVPRK
jgi:DNA-binding CsgD family transcriptional regulator